MGPSLAASYDEIPYPRLTHLDTRIDRLHAIAALYGLDARSANGCRVLELGCGPGTNLISLASLFPGSEFLGVDLSGRQIEMARAHVEELGLRNVTFLQKDLAEDSDAIGEFDYILAHGLFSWVPGPVREVLLALCARRLSPQGLAYISYNTLPGWYQKLCIRDAMRFSNQGDRSPGLVDRALALPALMKNSPAIDGVGRNFLAQGLETLTNRSEAYLIHEYLEDFNAPIYFASFLEMAEQAGLQYLADAEENFLVQDEWNPAAPLAQRYDRRTDQEQLSDFLRLRIFRKSLLCKATATVAAEPSLDRLRSLRVTSLLRQDPQPPSPGLTRFLRMDGKGALILGPSSIHRALVRLQLAYPGSLAYPDLLEEVRREVPIPDEPAFCAQILKLWKQGFLELTGEAPRFPAPAGGHPCVHALARSLAPHTTRVPTLSHAGVEIVDEFRRLLPRIDGTRSVQELAALALQEGILPRAPGLPPAEQSARAEAQVQRFLDWCRSLGLLAP